MLARTRKTTMRALSLLIVRWGRAGTGLIRESEAARGFPPGCRTGLYSIPFLTRGMLCKLQGLGIPKRSVGYVGYVTRFPEYERRFLSV